MNSHAGQLLQQIEAVVGAAGILSGKDLAGRSAGIWSGNELQAMALVRPATTAQVSRVMKLCHAAGQIVVPAGGMTGLAGGHKSTSADIVLSTERMNRIESLDVHSRCMTVEAGAILQTVQEAAADADLMFALDLGARASCTIGGNIATNAGGVRVLRYGMMREQVLGLEVVLADGTVVASMFNVLKNNTGYDLRQMFLGSEGTLGIITRAVLRLHEAPLAVETAILAVPSWNKVMSLLRFFDAALPGALGAYEVSRTRKPAKPAHERARTGRYQRWRARQFRNRARQVLADTRELRARAGEVRADLWLRRQPAAGSHGILCR
jgi:FAD/FMN-containing dehydrogenase